MHRDEPKSSEKRVRVYDIGEALLFLREKVVNIRLHVVRCVNIVEPERKEVRVHLCGQNAQLSVANLGGYLHAAGDAEERNTRNSA